MKHIAIFASGKGTNAVNIIEYFQQLDGIKVDCVICNNPKAKVLESIERLNTEGILISNDTLKNNVVELIRTLEDKKIDLIVLAGFMSLIPESLINRYAQKIVNIHPALLPKYGGKGMYGKHVHQAVFENKERETGITIHYVNEEYDKGAIIFQAKCDINKNDDPSTIAQKVQKLEHQHYPKVIKEILMKPD